MAGGQDVPRTREAGAGGGHNVRAILRDLRKPDIDEKIWERFSVRKEQTLWYYRSLAKIFCKRLPGQLSDELREIVEMLSRDGK